ncbi:MULTISPECIES: DUF3817 domain-containing protein [Mycolicibacterium]|jgi:integral membrane protein|uniref:Integral membrane protein n=2 Tax=Mycolicibacterium TaxID=1866885 RepID=A0A378TNG2_9MYCO|nr:MULTISPECIES: DUF3817 domain-containing protein [Mycolicibacterium]MCV7185617.1 DUF3817 domain-containing protein [Mycolicibacterium murale]BBY84326.1 membrane protein [Mycolicibacterium tokaiense]GFG58045.1 membrane protein [Mycolicibacterium murale]STZ61166.1 integral membrane protein [Mycolicibacterium tokaiense]
MASAYDLRTTAGRFRLVAFLEAASWIGLLVGMFFKYVGSPQTEIGVKIFGPIHGGIFIAFLVAALFAGLAYKWSAVTWLLALLGSIVPLGSVIFLIWAEKTGRLGAVDGAAAGIGPARSAPDAT